jgi:hypothetical protein
MWRSVEKLASYSLVVSTTIEGGVDLNMPAIPAFTVGTVCLVEPDHPLGRAYTTQDKTIRSERIPEIAQLAVHMLCTGEPLIEEGRNLNRLDRPIVRGIGKRQWNYRDGECKLNAPNHSRCS